MTLDALLAARAAIPDDDDHLPASITRGDLTALRRRRTDLDRRIRNAQQATATLASLPDDDPTWRADLEQWRAVLCADLLAVPRTRDPTLLALQRNLTVSIRTIDFGVGALTGSDYDLVSCRLGQLMVASGYAVQGADPASNYSGVLEWHGSLRELDRQAQDIARRRAQAEAQLADALLDDDARAQQEAAAKDLRDAFNSMRVRHGPDPNNPTLVPVDRTGTPLDELTLTDRQREALALRRAQLAEARAAREAPVVDGSS